MKVLIVLSQFLLFVIGIISAVRPAYAANFLTNYDFETQTVNPWEKSGGGAVATISSELVHGGTYALKVSHANIGSYGYQQTVTNLEGGMFYEVKGFGTSTDSNASKYFLRVAWYSSADGSGSQLSSPNDTASSDKTDGNWTEYDMVMQAPGSARSAKIRVVLTSKTSGIMASAYFDDLTFQESVAPTPPPTDTPSPTATPRPTATSTPTYTPMPTGTPTLSNTPTASFTPTETSDIQQSSMSGSPGSTAHVLSAEQTMSDLYRASMSGTLLTPYVFSTACIGLGFAILSGVFLWRQRTNYLSHKKEQ